MKGLNFIPPFIFSGQSWPAEEGGITLGNIGFGRAPSSLSPAKQAERRKHNQAQRRARRITRLNRK